MSRIQIIVRVRFMPLVMVSVLTLGCATVPPSPPVDAPPSGRLDLEFGGFDETLCATLRMPASMQELDVTFTVGPSEKVVDPSPILTSTNADGVARASWTLTPGIGGDWTVNATIDTPAGIASAEAYASTGLTANPRQNQSPPCED